MSEPASTAPLLTIDDVMDRLNIGSRQTLANWRSNGTGPPWIKVSGAEGRPNGLIRYPEDGLNAYLAARTRRGAA